MSSREVSGRTRAPGVVAWNWMLVGLLLVGVWLSIAPFALEYRAVGIPLRATVNDSVVGAVVVVFALIGLSRPGRSEH